MIPLPVFQKISLQGRLLIIAAVIMLLLSVILTLSPAVRLHSWQVELRWQHWLGYAVWLVGFYLMHRQIHRRLPEGDPYLLPIGAILSGWGLLTIWRLDSNLGLRQTSWLGISLLVFWGILQLPRVLMALRRYKYLWLIGTILLTAITFIFGTYPGGGEPRLWLNFGGIYLQPSEPLKLMLIAFLAAYLADRLPISFGLMQLLLPTLVLFGLSLFILTAQRDLGTATLLIVLYAAMIYQATGKRRVIVLSAALLLGAALIGYQLYDVIRVRIGAWLDPWIDPSGQSYQIVQSLLAVATGGAGGTGFGLGNPGIVPVVSSDFIFAAISEENGIIGGLVIILLSGLIASRGLLAGLRAPNLYQRLLSGGLVVFLVFQSALIIGGNLRLFPLTGVTLPFVSYGGSSLLTSFIALALLVLVSTRSEGEPAPLPKPQPILLTGAGLLSLLLLVSLASGYWALFRSEELLQRVDNPRWSISERFVKRGSILDRNNQVIVHTTGQPGEYTRQVLQPALASVVGYTNVIYGKAGLESSLDPYLRGVLGNPSSTIVSSSLLFAQPPPGLDVRLSIDLRIQQTADSLLQGYQGALVLLNAQTGEILAMASQPTFDPNLLNEKWSEWIQSPQAVFLNRATQGQYPVGGAIGPFLLADVMGTGYLPVPTFNSYVSFNETTWTCAFSIPVNPDWGMAIENGCPGARLALSEQFSAEHLIQLYNRIGFTETPELSLPTARAGTLQASSSRGLLALGQTELLVSPLQVALAAGMISMNGTRAVPRIASAVKTPHQGWVIINTGSMDPSQGQLTAAGSAARQIQNSSMPVWQSISTALTADHEISWYIAGTIPDWHAAPLAMALVLENGTPSQAREIGSALMRSVTLP